MKLLVIVGTCIHIVDLIFRSVSLFTKCWQFILMIKSENKLCIPIPNVEKSMCRHGFYRKVKLLKFFVRIALKIQKNKT